MERQRDAILCLKECPQCGYDLAGLPAAHACPECGFSFQRRLYHLKLRKSPRWGQWVDGLAVLFLVILGGLILLSINGAFVMDAMLIIPAGLLIFFSPLLDRWFRRRHSPHLLFSDEGICRRMESEAWSGLLRYEQVKALHLEKHRRRGVWRLIIIRQVAELSHTTWMDGVVTMDDEEATAFEKDIQSRIKSAGE